VCRNIKTLFNFEPPVTQEEIRAASLQFVRKVTGFNKPSKANGWRFNADRMVMDYTLKCYVPAAGGTASDMSQTLAG